MAAIANKRSVMTLFTRPNCPHSHRVRLVLAEKGINFDTVEVIGGDIPEDLIDLNPYQTIPTLVDRDLATRRAKTTATSAVCLLCWRDCLSRLRR